METDSWPDVPDFSHFVPGEAPGPDHLIHIQRVVKNLQAGREYGMSSDDPGAEICLDVARRLVDQAILGKKNGPAAHVMLDYWGRFSGVVIDEFPLVFMVRYRADLVGIKTMLLANRFNGDRRWRALLLLRFPPDISD